MGRFREALCMVPVGMLLADLIEAIYNLICPSSCFGGSRVENRRLQACITLAWWHCNSTEGEAQSTVVVCVGLAVNVGGRGGRKKCGGGVGIIADPTACAFADTNTSLLKHRNAWRPTPDDRILRNPIYRVPVPSLY